MYAKLFLFVCWNGFSWSPCKPPTHYIANNNPEFWSSRLYIQGVGFTGMHYNSSLYSSGCQTQALCRLRKHSTNSATPWVPCPVYSQSTRKRIMDACLRLYFSFCKRPGSASSLIPKTRLWDLRTNYVLCSPELRGCCFSSALKESTVMSSSHSASRYLWSHQFADCSPTYRTSSFLWGLHTQLASP